MATFVEVDIPEPHRARALEILRRHPEVRALFGRNPHTALVCIGVVGLQLALAYAVREAPFWVVALLAWGVGAFVAHASLVAYHECAHQLVFRSRFANSMLGIFTNLPTLMPSFASFQRYHLKHHQYQGDYSVDADLPSQWEIRWFGRRSLGKAAWMLFQPIIHSARTARFAASGRIRFLTPWVAGNIAVQVIFDVLAIMYLGASGMTYLVLSLFFAVGFHPLGARWLQEHVVIQEGQETSSYYGFLNKVALNIGYHNEHHDFPFIPWNRLPRLTALAPEMYEPLYRCRSWFALWIRFLIDPRLTLAQRITRPAGANARRQPLPPGAYAPGTFHETRAGAL